MVETFSKRERLFRGKSIEDLKKFDTREFAKFIKSRGRRTIMRNFQVIEDFVKRCQKKQENGKIARTHLREIIVVPQLVGMTIGVHNGKEFFPVKITQEMLGHRLGEFALTRKPVKHGAAGVGSTKSSSSLSVK